MFGQTICMSPPCQFYNTGFIHLNLHYIITMLKSFNIKKYHLTFNPPRSLTSLNNFRDLSVTCIPKPDTVVWLWLICAFLAWSWIWTRKYIHAIVCETAANFPASYFLPKKIGKSLVQSIQDHPLPIPSKCWGFRWFHQLIFLKELFNGLRTFWNGIMVLWASYSSWRHQ